MNLSKMISIALIVLSSCGVDAVSRESFTRDVTVHSEENQLQFQYALYDNPERVIQSFTFANGRKKTWTLLWGDVRDRIRKNLQELQTQAFSLKETWSPAPHFAYARIWQLGTIVDAALLEIDNEKSIFKEKLRESEIQPLSIDSSSLSLSGVTDDEANSRISGFLGLQMESVFHELHVAEVPFFEERSLLVEDFTAMFGKKIPVHVVLKNHELNWMPMGYSDKKAAYAYFINSDGPIYIHRRDRSYSRELMTDEFILRDLRNLGLIDRPICRLERVFSDLVHIPPKYLESDWHEESIDLSSGTLKIPALNAECGIINEEDVLHVFNLWGKIELSWLLRVGREYELRNLIVPKLDPKMTLAELREKYLSILYKDMNFYY